MKKRSDQASLSPYLCDLLALLWPPIEGRAAGVWNVPFVVIPNLHEPKLVIPRKPHAAAAAALRNYRASATGRGLVMIEAVALGARMGLLDLLPSRLTVQSSADSIDVHLSQLLATRVNVAMYIGPQRAVQKPVLQVLDSRGRTVAFAKLAINELTSSLIRCEAEAISRLTARNLQHLSTPRVLSFGRWHDSDLIVQSAAAPGGSNTRLRRLLPEATQELAGSFGIVESEWTQSEYRTRLFERVSAHGAASHAGTILQTLHWLDEELRAELVQFGSWHGDWAPWNMTSTESQVIAWDWEHFESGMPVGFDAVHFDLSEQLFDGGTSVVDAFSSVLEGRRGDLTSSACSGIGRSQVVTLYVLEIVTRYLERGEDLVGGTRLSRIDEWLPKVLARCQNALHSRV